MNKDEDGVILGLSEYKVARCACAYAGMHVPLVPIVRVYPEDACTRTRLAVALPRLGAVLQQLCNHLDMAALRRPHECGAPLSVCPLEARTRAEQCRAAAEVATRRSGAQR